MPIILIYNNLRIWVNYSAGSSGLGVTAPLSGEEYSLEIPEDSIERSAYV
jgi:hypothetical protein